jgi:transposase InsO family protein
MVFWKKKKETKKTTRTKKTAKAKPKAKPVIEEAAPSPKKTRKSPGTRYPLEVKVQAVKASEEGLSPKEIGELIGVSATSLAGWIRAYQKGGVDALTTKPGSKSAHKLCRALEERIKEHRREHPERGVRRIRDELKRDEGLQVSAETVRRVVNDAGLSRPPVQPKRNPPKPRRFERELPNALWQIDIFTFQLKRMYPVYLIGIIDDHSRYMVGHGLYRQQTAEAVLEVVKGAIGQWGAPREILSDNGRQFVAWRGKSRFQKVLRRQGIQHVRSAPQHPMTLGKIERFWQTIWEEFLAEAVFASFADACQRTDHWVAYYNHQRPHQGIAGACPADRFYGVQGDVEQALEQGWLENSERIALGQETRPPLYLLGKLGNTDVRVTRKGDDIEVKVGDAIHEVIRTGAPFTVDEQGTYRRGEQTDEMEGHGRAGAVPGGGDGAQGAGAAEGDMRDVFREPADAAPCDGEAGRDIDPGAEAAEGWAQGQERGAEDGFGACDPQERAGEGAYALEDEVRDSQDLPGPGAQVRPGRALAGGAGGGGRKKTPQPPQAREEEAKTEEDDGESECYGIACWPWQRSEDGVDR